jgi:DNA-binding transcriptional regulator YbjK
VQLWPYDSAVVVVEKRQARGERRRTAILEAALRVIAERGVSATTHRAVANAAGVPASTTTYYFESLDELLDEALLLFVRAEAGRLHALAYELDGQQMPPAQIARLLVEELRAGDNGGEVAQFELYLEASRRPALREVARECLRLYEDVATAALRAAGSPRAEEGARVFVALLDGLGLHRIASGASQDVERALLALFVPFAMDDAELRAWRDRLAG